MKILVTGATGKIGTDLVDYLTNLRFEIVPISRHSANSLFSADLTDNKSVERIFAFHKPNLVIHLAGLSNIDYCERNKEASFLSNVLATENISRQCKAHEVRLIFFSTDYVYGSCNLERKEDDVTIPSTQYGKDKVRAEQIVTSMLSNFVIFRTAQIYGTRSDYITLVCQALNSGKVFKAFTNVANCPTWIGDIRTIISKVTTSKQSGIFNCAGPKALSRYEFAQNIAKAHSLDTTSIVPSVLHSDLNLRPKKVALCSERCLNTFGFKPKSFSTVVSLHSNGSISPCR